MKEGAMDSQKSLEGFEPVFGEAEGALEEESIPCALLPFVFYLHSTISASDRSRIRLLRLQVTDFHSNTWQTIQTSDLLEDLVCVVTFLLSSYSLCVSLFCVSNEIHVFSGFLSYYYFFVSVFLSFCKSMFLPHLHSQYEWMFVHCVSFMPVTIGAFSVFLP